MINLVVKDLNKRFGGLHVLKGVNFEINGPELVGLIGPNGAGKTTVTNILDGAIKPNSGTVYLNGQRIDQSIITLALCYFIVNVFIVLLGGMFMSVVDDMDVTTAMSSVIATLMNIGPGFGDVGPSENFAFISDTGKWFLSLLMLVGRLEMFSALVLFYPSFWRT